MRAKLADWCWECVLAGNFRSWIGNGSTSMLPSRFLESPHRQAVEPMTDPQETLPHPVEVIRCS